MKQPPLSSADETLRARPVLVWAAVIALVLLGATLRIHNLDAVSLWKDEIQQARMSAGSVGSVISGLRNVENDMPLDYLVQHVVISLTSQTDFWVRFHAAMFGILTLPLAFALLRTLLGPSAALMGLALLALSPLHVNHSQDGRPYALLILLTVLSSWALWRLLNSEQRKRWVALYAITAIACVWTHLSAVVVLACQQGWVVTSLGWSLWKKEEVPRARLWAGGWSLAVAALCALIMIPVTQRVTGGAIGEAGVGFGPLTFDFITSQINGFTFGHDEYSNWFSAWLIGGPLLLIGLAWGLRCLPKATWFLICVGPGFVAMMLSLCWVREHWVSIRYFLPALIPFLAFLGMGVIALVEFVTARRPQTALGSLAVLLVLFALLAAPFLWTHPVQKRDWRGASQWVSANLDFDDTLLVSNSDWRSLRYYLEQSTWLGMPERISTDDFADIDPEGHAGKHIFVRSGSSRDELRGRLASHEEVLDVHRIKIFLIDE